jgi:hypothetical protein
MFYHELAHIINYRNKKYLAYHTIENCTTYKHMRKIIRTAIKAEKYTDNVAKVLISSTHPHITYVGYTPEMIYYFKKYWLKQVRIYLENNIAWAREKYLEQFR